MSEQSANALNELKVILNQILESKGGNKSKLVQEFENKLNEFWEQDKEIFEEGKSDVLNDLLCDMAYYQPNPAIRMTDKGLMDDAKLDKLVKESLAKLND